MRESDKGSDRHLSDPGKEARRRAGLPVVPAFDGYRAFAIFAVVLLHLATLSGLSAVGREDLIARVIWGTVGHAVEILFIVSGFVVFLPTVARKGDFGGIFSFAIRRGARLLPAYWLVLLISLVVIATLSPFPSVMPGARDLLFNFTGTMVPAGLLVHGVPIGFSLNPPLWTLSVEVCFYIVLPFVAWAFFRRPFLGLATALLITVFWTLAFDHHAARIAELLGQTPDFDELFRLKISSLLQLPTWAYSFGLGMAGAWCWVRASATDAATPESARWKDLAPIFAGGSGIALLVLAWFIGGGLDQTRESLVLSLLLSTALAVFMVSLSLSPARWQQPFALPAVRRLGDISYGVYLIHMVLAFTLASELSMPNDGSLGAFLIWTVAVVPASVLYGYLSARFLEQPVRRWARKYGRRDEA